MKLGKQPARPDTRDLRLDTYTTARALPKPPVKFGHYPQVTTWGMLGNDRYGDCVWAGAAHETMMWLAAHRATATFTDRDVLADYATVTGFNPADPSTDRGTDVHNALNYRRATGIRDHHGHRHKLGAYLALKPGDTTQLVQAAYLFGAVGIGIEFPTSAGDQFNAGQPWTVVKGATIDGGHYIPIVGADPDWIYVVTWGRVQPVARPFLATYCDEAYALLSPDYLSHGMSPEGFNLAQLNADLAHL